VHAQLFPNQMRTMAARSGHTHI